MPDLNPRDGTFAAYLEVLFRHFPRELPSPYERLTPQPPLGDNETPWATLSARGGGGATVFATDTDSYLGQSVAWQPLGKLFLRVISDQLRCT